MKEISVFSIGPSRKISTWSGIPFFLTHQLEMNGIKVNHINIAPNKMLGWLYRHSILLFHQYRCSDSEYDYMRSHINRLLTIIKVTIYQILYRNAETDLFLSYSVKPILRKNKSVMLSDWTFEQYIENQLKRTLYPEESEYVNYENQCLKRAKTIISLFPLSAQQLSCKLHKEVLHLGINVVNNCYDGDVNSLLIEEKWKTRKILFIGRSAYVHGAAVLLKAFEEIRDEYPNLELHYIGLLPSHFNLAKIPQGVFFHGYLKKENEQERMLYYQLLKRAFLFINPTQEWGGYSSTIEAMYFYTPVIVAPYKEFVNEFGENLNFGNYIDSYSQTELACLIRKYLCVKKDEYYIVANMAHKAVEGHTWEKFTESLLYVM